MSLLQIILIVWALAQIYMAVRMMSSGPRALEREAEATARHASPLPSKLLRLYFTGWVAISPLIFAWAIALWWSLDQSLADFWLGLTMGLLNLGILWTALYLAIAAVTCVIHWLKR
jgi:hypothetical protein